MKPLRPTTKRLKYCQTCDTEVGEEQWCEGCAAFICTACDLVQGLPLDHEPEDHGGGKHQGTDDSL